MQNLPFDYIKKMQELLGNDYDRFIETYSSKYFQGFRINPLKINTLNFIKEFAPQLHLELKNVPWCPTGYYYPSDQTLSKHPFYHAGLYYIQEPSAMSPVEWMNVRPGMKVLDLCAAPGGKSVQIAGKLQNLGLLVSNDISLKRTKAILKNIEISGITNCIITNSEPAQLAINFSDFFDRILVDAPCSGEGMFRKDPSLIKSYHEVLTNITSIQTEILEQASKMLKPGGRLIYSTCTFNKEENEEIIKRFMSNHSNFYIIDPFTHFPEAAAYGFSRGIEIPSARLFPHKLQGEGHFIAILEKTLSHSLETSCLQESSTKNSLSQCVLSVSENPQKKTTSITHKKSSKKTSFPKKNPVFDPQNDFCSILSEFEKETLCSPIDGEIIYSQGSLYRECGFQKHLQGIRVIRNGLYLGDIKNNNFIPSSAFIMASKRSDFKHSISFNADDPLLYKYLRCETLHLDAADGYHFICVDEYPLGLVKVKNGIAKNLYNQNWRLL